MKRFLAWRLVRRAIIVSAIVIALPVTGAVAWAGYVRLSGNIHQIGTNDVYRSAQLSTSSFQALVQERKIKTILNLRGAQKEAPWYHAERLVATTLGVTYIDLPLSANEEPNDETLDRLVATMRTADKPLLIHCEGGADRSGLAAALYRRVIEGASYEKAAAELSFRYGHFPWLTSRTGAMDRAFARRAMIEP